MTKKLRFIILLFLASISFVKAQLEYKDVAPVFFNKCTSCHHEGSTFPPFTSYSNVANYTGIIANYLAFNKMPPWPPDTTYTRFVHERAITLSDKNKILDWIANGAPAGDTTLAPPVPVYPKTLLNGTPNLVLSIPTYTSSATTTDKYVCFSVPSGLTQNRVLRAYEIVPGNASIVHHAVINVDTLATTTSDLSGFCYTIPGDFSLGDYAPGSAPAVFPGVFPAKFGITIKAGSKIVFQMHYPAGSAGIVDSTKIRLYFYPIGEPGIRPIYASVPMQNWAFSIPANTTQTVTAMYPQGFGGIPADISVYSIFPHSHKICRSITNYAYNGSTTIPLCRINNWNFNWQGFYTFPKMVKIPTGYKLYGKHFFDNTTNNPYNPSPLTVSAGFDTSDEMVFDAIMWTPYFPGDETIDIASILSTDSLLTTPTSIKEVNTKVNIKTYPNPFTDKIKISYDLSSLQYVSISIYNLVNEELIRLSSQLEAPGTHAHEWDGKNGFGVTLPAGVYIYKATIGKNTYGGKLILKPKN